MQGLVYVYTGWSRPSSKSQANMRVCCTVCNAGMLEGDDPQEALDGFRQVVTMEQEKGEWYGHGNYQ